MGDKQDILWVEGTTNKRETAQQTWWWWRRQEGKQETVQCSSTGDSGWQQLQPPPPCSCATSTSMQLCLIVCRNQHDGSVQSNLGFQQQLYHMHFILIWGIFFQIWRNKLQGNVGIFGNDFGITIFGTVKRTPLGSRDFFHKQYRNYELAI